MSTSDHPIPVYIVAGFLGAGKTSLLNHLLRDEHGLRLAVIVNDFGTIPVDAQLVAGQVDTVVSMANGCLCCAASDDELDRNLATLVEQPGVEGIVIEASGLAEPAILMGMVGTAAQHLPISIGGLVEVVDAPNLRETVAEHPSVARRLRDADLVVLNKADMVTAARLQELREDLRELAPSISPVVTAYGRVEARLLFARALRNATSYSELQHAAHSVELTSVPIHSHAHSAAPESEPEAEHAHPHTHLHDHYVTCAVDTPRPLHPGRFMEFLNAGAGGAYRVKGFIQLAGPTEDESFLCEKVGHHLSLERWFPADDTQMGLVFIGVDLDPAAIDEACTACLRRPLPTGGDGTATAPDAASAAAAAQEIDPVREGELWAFYPYLHETTNNPEDVWWEQMDEDDDDLNSVTSSGEFLVDPDEDPDLLP